MPSNGQAEPSSSDDVYEYIEVSGLHDGYNKQTNIKKQNDSQLFQIHEAKDRAQLTTTTALLVAHVSLLKSLLGEGPDGNQFYKPLLILVLSSLACQVLAGVLALAIIQMKNQMKQGQGDICDDMCCCTIRRRPAQVRLQRDLIATRLAGNYDKMAPGWSQVESTETPYHCCPCVCVSYRVPDVEDEVSRRYDKVLMELIDTEMQAAWADTESESLTAAIADMRAQLSQTKTSKEEVEQRIKKAKAEKQKHERKRRERKTLRTMEDVLSDRLHDLRMESLLKRLSFWQSVLNFVLYAVFLCNAFVTGLGVAGNSESGGNIITTGNPGNTGSTGSNGVYVTKP